jgi:dTDP-4-dehydrorhamnose 3,5-epimerase
VKVSKAPLADVLVIETDRYQDSRGHFAETWNQKRYEEAGIQVQFVQDNFSFSRRGVLRGLHFQQPYPQVKLVQVLRGAVYDVVVDLRKQSPTFGKWWGTELTEENGKQLYVPVGFAHGFLVTSEDSVFLYKCSEFYHPEAEHTLLWNDPDVGIQWPVEHPQLSSKDASAQSLSQWLQRPESKYFQFK